MFDVLATCSGATTAAATGILTQQNSQENQGSPLHLLDIPPPQTPAMACNQRENNVASVPTVAVEENTALTPVCPSPVSGASKAVAALARYYSGGISSKVQLSKQRSVMSAWLLHQARRCELCDIHTADTWRFVRVRVCV